MRVIVGKIAGVVALHSAIQLPVTTPTQPPGFALINSDLLAFFQAVSSPNLCMAYTYDRNGNLTVKTNATYGSTATWGSSTYGCFTWTAAP